MEWLAVLILAGWAFSRPAPVQKAPDTGAGGSGARDGDISAGDIIKTGAAALGGLATALGVGGGTAAVGGAAVGGTAVGGTAVGGTAVGGTATTGGATTTGGTTLGGTVTTTTTTTTAVAGVPFGFVLVPLLWLAAFIIGNVVSALISAAKSLERTIANLGESPRNLCGCEEDLARTLLTSNGINFREEAVEDPRLDAVFAADGDRYTMHRDRVVLTPLADTPKGAGLVAEPYLWEDLQRLCRAVALTYVRQLAWYRDAILARRFGFTFGTQPGQIPPPDETELDAVPMIGGTVVSTAQRQLSEGAVANAQPALLAQARYRALVDAVSAIVRRENQWGAYDFMDSIFGPSYARKLYRWFGLGGAMVDDGAHQSDTPLPYIGVKMANAFTWELDPAVFQLEPPVAGQVLHLDINALHDGRREASFSWGPPV